MLKPPPDLLRSEIFTIGLVAVYWSYLEHAAERMIWAILEVDASTGRAITAPIQMRSRLKMLVSLIEARHPPLLEAVKNIKDTIEKLEADRNLVVHGIWARDQQSRPTATSLRRKSSGPHLIYGEVFPRERMTGIIQGIIDAGAYVHSLTGVIENASSQKFRTPAPPEHTKN
ncbi:hypothetical protein [Bradyrhizobium sp. NAS96.2]|uniref:hypothetical protein n=1 Tax=Bradyrhizobium sp. NAS96.2 TaxID=1680160 RepID=UPI0009405B03|nr:hypothetical protein [Bradyrhizobium sp. NAS96.2]OKO73614.1 hypothetical protein AC628_23955 [Bradyrhizobium sp. NAS96.2]